ncbi:MAG: hypothetical protein AVDCRST_MAG85-1955, partial [uncultured Solirubrobacteraceae bacterium]
RAARRPRACRLGAPVRRARLAARLPGGHVRDARVHGRPRRAARVGGAPARRGLRRPAHPRDAGAPAGVLVRDGPPRRRGPRPGVRTALGARPARERGSGGAPAARFALGVV